ncbi:MAG: BatD family protein [Planctomycetota bacterium]
MSRRRVSPWLAPVVALVATLVAAAPAGAAEVDVSLSPRETHVGVPATLTVTVTNADRHERPAIGPVPDLRIEAMGGGSRREVTQIINGDVTRQVSITYSFRVTPTRAGTVTIPSFTVTADGEAHETAPVDLVALPVGTSGRFDDDSEDVVAVEITADRTRVYLGEPVRLALRIWLHPHREARYRYTMSDGDMWRRIELRMSGWGPFLGTLDELVGQGRRPRGRDVVRAGADGQERAFYLYEIPTTFWPAQVGPLELEDVTVVVDYPTRLRRDFFDLAVVRSRQVVVAAAAPEVEVVAPPEAGRPPIFEGAVGRFAIEASARPTEVAVGDPITLTIAIADRTPGGTRLDLLPPPPLTRIAALTDDFDIPTEPLAGTVDGTEKVFRQTLRARHDGVARIPPIPYAFFDAETGTYQTILTDPIELVVAPASVLPMSDVVGGAAAGREEATELTETAGGLVANYPPSTALLETHGGGTTWWLWPVVLVPPLLWVGVVAGRAVAVRRRDESFSRRRRARRAAIGLIRRADRDDPQQQAEWAAAAVRGYVADRWNLPGGLTRTDVREVLARHQAPEALIEEVEALLSRCEAVCYAPAPNGTSEDLAHEAIRVINRLERERLA